MAREDEVFVRSPANGWFFSRGGSEDRPRGRRRKDVAEKDMGSPVGYAQVEGAEDEEYSG